MTINKFHIMLVAAAALATVAWVPFRQGGKTVPNQMWVYRVDMVPGLEQWRTGLPDVEVIQRNGAVNEQLINQRAAEGWELIAVGGTFYYFRRPK